MNTTSTGRRRRAPLFNATALRGLALAACLAAVSTPAAAQVYWDGGAPGNADNGQVDGGDGAWDLVSPNWTTADGAANSAYPTTAPVVVFQGSEGFIFIDGAPEVAGITVRLPQTLIGDLTLAGAGGRTVFLVDYGANQPETSLWGRLLGSGVLVKDGPGTLLLDAPDSEGDVDIEVRSGRLLAITLPSNADVTVNGGVLEIWSGRIASLAGSGGTVHTNGLTVSQSIDTVFAGTITGSGTFVFNGSGTLTLTGDSSGFRGGTYINSGEVRVDGVLGWGVVVRSGGRLSGAGAVGTTDVYGGARLAPGGDDIGALTVNGSLTLRAGSILEIQVDPTGTTSDGVHVRDDVTIHGGSVIHVGADGNYRLRSRYTILTAGRGLTGAFDSVTSDFAFLNPSLVYDYGARTVTLTLERNDVEFAALARTQNQRAVARGVDSIGIDAENPVYDAVAMLSFGGDEIPGAFDALSGEVHASARTALIEDSRFLRDAVAGRLRATAGAPASPTMAFDGDGRGYGAWAQAYGGWADADGRSNTAGMDRSAGGVLLGADMAVSDVWRVGIFGGFGQTDIDLDDRASNVTGDGYHLGAYAGGQWDRIGVRGGVGYSRYGLLTERSPTFASFSDRLRVKSDFVTVQAFGEIGYRFDVRDVAFEPFAALAHVDVEADAFAETGGPVALHGDGGASDATFTTLGLRAASDHQVGGMDVTARAAFGWRHALDDVVPTSTQAFAEGAAFTVAGAPIARDAAVIEAGLDVALADRVTLGARYDGQLSSDAQQHGFILDLNVRF